MTEERWQHLMSDEWMRDYNNKLTPEDWEWLHKNPEKLDELMDRLMLFTPLPEFHLDEEAF